MNEDDMRKTIRWKTTDVKLESSTMASRTKAIDFFISENNQLILIQAITVKYGYEEKIKFLKNVVQEARQHHPNQEVKW